MKPRMVNGEPVCALTCPLRESCPFREIGIMETDRPCLPGIRAQRDAARRESAGAFAEFIAGQHVYSSIWMDLADFRASLSDNSKKEG